MKSFLNLVFVFCFTALQAEDSLSVNRTEIIYGRKDGMALTMLMQVPRENANGKAIVSVVSGNWRSNHDLMNRYSHKDQIYLQHGYTVFNVVHGSQPRYTIPDQVEDIKRAVRFIRHNAGRYGIDPDRIGITGASSGGHLSLMVAMADDDNSGKSSRDTIDRVSARVQAIAVFFPPTDFLNYGQNGFNATASQALLVATGLAAAFDFKKWNDTTRTYVSISDIETRKKIAKEMSPVYFVSPDDPPTMIVHGDADRVVPLQQSELIINKLSEAKVPNRLIVKSGAGHGWRQEQEEEKNFIDWFDKYLK